MADALKGGIDVRSRVGLVAAACLVVSGLFVGGLGAALAFAGPTLRGDTENHSTAESTTEHSDHPDDATPAKTPTRTSTPSTQPDRPTTTSTAPPDDGDCEDNGGCGPGLPWWPFPWRLASPPQGGGLAAAIEGSVGIGGNRTLPPPMQLPAHLLPAPELDPPTLFDAELPIAPPQLPLPPVTLPVIVAPPAAIGGAASGPGEPRQAPSAVAGAAPLQVREPQPAGLGGITLPPASFRIGYSEYLRSAGLPQLLVLAVPGVAGMLVLTAVGGLVGYRQARAGHAVRTGVTARFVK